MARNTASTEAPQTGAVSIAPPEVAVSGRKDSRSIILTVPMKNADGSAAEPKQMSRNDYIRARADQGVSRAQIRQEVIALQGVDDIPYQVVFAATKGHPSYEKDKKGKADAGSEPSEEASE